MQTKGLSDIFVSFSSPFKKGSEHSIRLLLSLGTARIISHTYYNPRTQLLNWNGQKKKKKKISKLLSTSVTTPQRAQHSVIINGLLSLSTSQLQYENTEAAANLLKFLPELKIRYSFKGSEVVRLQGGGQRSHLQGKAFAPMAVPARCLCLGAFCLTFFPLLGFCKFLSSPSFWKIWSTWGHSERGKMLLIH